MANIHNEGWENYAIGATNLAYWNIIGTGFKIQNTTVFHGSRALQYSNPGSGGDTIMWPTPDNYRGLTSVSAAFLFHAVTTEQTWSLVARSTSDAATCYLTVFEPTGSPGAGIGLYKTIDFVTTQIGSTVVGTIALDAWYRVFLIPKTGNKINVYVYRPSDANWLNNLGTFGTTRTPAITLSDTSIPANSGYSGLQGSQNAAETQAIFTDDFAADTLQAYVAGSSSNGSSSTSSLAVNVPAATVDGDLLVACITWLSSTATITAPGGWTLIRSDATGAMKQALYRLVAQGAAGSYTWSFSAAVACAGGMLTIRSADVVDVTPIDAHGAATGSNSIPTAPSVTTTIANDLLLLFAGDDATASIACNSSVNQDIYNATTGVPLLGELCGGDLAFAGPGATLQEPFVGNVSGDWIAQTVAVFSAANPPWDGTWGPSQFIQFPDPYMHWAKNEVVGY